MNGLTKLEKKWILYDVGNSAFALLVSTILPIYFKNVATNEGISMANSTAYWSYAVSISTLIVAILGPILGTIADIKDHKKNLFTLFLMIGVIGCAGLILPKSCLLFLIVFIIAKVGFSGSLIFYDAMINDVASEDRLDVVSSYGYAWGYIGSCIPFTACLILILLADKISISSTLATMISFLIIALWWLITSLPLLKSYKQKYYIEKSENQITESFSRLGTIFKELKSEKKILTFLLAFFFYIDGVYTIIDMASSYGKDVGISDNNLLFALLLTQVVAFPCSILFGKLTTKYKSETLIASCILGYFFIALFALQLDKPWEFWFLAVCVAVFQGAIQALSRSYFARIIPKNKSSEYFGIFDIFGKGASVLGTLLMGISTQLSGSSKTGVLCISFMFIIGFFLFKKSEKINNEDILSNDNLSNEETVLPYSIADKN